MRAELEVGHWYDGERTLFDFTGEYRPSRHLNFKAGYRQNDISLPGGDVAIKVLSVDANINITPDMQILNQLQYDNISKDYEPIIPFVTSRYDLVSVKDEEKNRHVFFHFKLLYFIANIFFREKKFVSSHIPLGDNDELHRLVIAQSRN